jgi:hypothetical protein
MVDGLVAYRFEFVTSRFDDFLAHIASFRALTSLNGFAAASMSLQQLLLTSAGFDTWTSALAIPLRAEVERLEIGVQRSHDGVTALLVESPERLPLGLEVTLRIFRTEAGGSETLMPSISVLAGTQCAAFIVPVAADGSPTFLATGTYRLEFSLDRIRYRALVTDDDSNLRQVASLTLTV